MPRRLAYHPGVKCQFCGSEEMRKCGRNRSGTQKYQCRKCSRRTTPNPKSIAHSPQTRQRALRLVAEGLSQRKAGRILKVSGQSIGRWLKKYVDALPAQPPKPATSEVTELDELYTFVKSKKNKRYLITAVDRKTRCFMSWSLVAECTTEAIQALVDQQFCLDGYAGYRQVNYRRSRHLVGRGKSQTYSVEANNAELLAVGASDAGAKSDAGLRRAITLFVHCWNARQMLRQLYPKYRRGLSEFISL